MHQGRQTTHFEIENHLTYFLPICGGISALNIFVHITLTQFSFSIKGVLRCTTFLLTMERALCPRLGIVCEYFMMNQAQGMFFYSLQIDLGLVWDCPCLHGRPTFGPSCTEFVYTECWHFDNGATSKFDNVHIEHGGLSLVLPLAVRLFFFVLSR